MDFIDQDASMLSNYEVYSFLKNSAAAQGGNKSSVPIPQNVKTVEFETLEYFTKVLPKATVNVPSEDSFLSLMRSLAKYPLTKTERLQIVNLMPKSLLDFYLIVEECEERFREEQIGEILGLVASCSSTSNS